MKKLLSILNWAIMMLLPLLALILTPIIYPLVYPYRNFEWAKKKPLWYFWDDEDGLYGAEYWRKAKGITKDNFWTSYRWLALRNPMWNMHASLKPILGEEVYISMKGNLTRDGKEIDLYKVAVFHYEDENGKWVGNSGEILSKKYSILGKTMIWFTIKNKLYWRFSYAENLFSKLWIELQLGIGSRYTFRLKAKWKPNINN
jgi:hypothetical protein